MEAIILNFCITGIWLFPYLLALCLWIFKLNKTDLIHLFSFYAILLVLITLIPFLFATQQYSATLMDFSFDDYDLRCSLVLNQSNRLLLFLLVFLSVNIGVFSIHYIKDGDSLQNYFRVYFFFIASMCLFLLSSSWILLFFAWEWVAFSSFLLIGFYGRKHKALVASRISFMISKLGDICFFFSLVICIAIFKTDDMEQIRLLFGNLDDGMKSVIFIGFVLGIICKAGQIPFFGWLINAMKAPTPITALFHSSTMVVLGILFLYKNDFLLEPKMMDYLFYFVFAGLPIILIKGLKAIQAKEMLVYLTMYSLGFMILGIGMDMFSVSMQHFYFQAISKSWLFLVIGVLYFYFDFYNKPYVSIKQLCASIHLPPFLRIIFFIGLVIACGFPFIFDQGEYQLYQGLQQLLASRSQVFVYYVYALKILSSILILRFAYYILTIKKGYHHAVPWRISWVLMLPIIVLLAFWLYQFQYSIPDSQYFILKITAIIASYVYIRYKDLKEMQIFSKKKEYTDWNHINMNFVFFSEYTFYWLGFFEKWLFKNVIYGIVNVVNKVVRALSTILLDTLIRTLHVGTKNVMHLWQVNYYVQIFIFIGVLSFIIFLSILSL